MCSALSPTHMCFMVWREACAGVWKQFRDCAAFSCVVARMRHRVALFVPLPGHSPRPLRVRPRILRTNVPVHHSTHTMNVFGDRVMRVLCVRACVRVNGAVKK